MVLDIRYGGEEAALFIGITSISAFVMTVTIIVLIMQGNMRSFYHELLTHAKAEFGESGYLNTAVEMAAYHHEWWNGKGYPYGVSGEEIPLCARIMAVEDVFDALTSDAVIKALCRLKRRMRLSGSNPVHILNRQL